MEKAQNKVVLLSCVKSKRDMACAAKDMYVSPLFRKMYVYAESLQPQKIFILSARYGLLAPADVIEPYEQTLKTMRTHEKVEWAQTVLEKIRKQSDLNKDLFVFLAGTPYRKPLLPHMRHYAIPMEGLSFGRQLKWLGEQRT